MAAALAISVPATRQVSKTKQMNTEEGQRKLPRPIVFWSINERTAYRRNRVVQTRLNMIYDDIASQRETSRKNIRYEAHKFRQKSGKYYSHPSAGAKDSSSVVNIAPPEWINNYYNLKQQQPKQKQNQNYNADSDDDDSDSDADDNEKNGNATVFTPRKTGIITRATTPSVKFSMYKKVHKIEDDLKIDDLENSNPDIDSDRTNTSITKINPHARSMSAIPYRNIPDLPGQSIKRQQSAFPSLRSTVATNYNDFQNTNKNKEGNEDVHKVKMLRSDTFFDKSKAAYQLRQDLRKKANLRKQGRKTEVFTLQDALHMEKEKGIQGRDKVKDYISRIEATKLAERNQINKWTRDEIEHQLHL